MNGDSNALYFNRTLQRQNLHIHLPAGKDKYLAEDIFPGCLYRIIDTLRGGRYTDEGKFLPWAMRIAHNLCGIISVK